MSHDEHFLSRIERLEREHAEIALGLYYDSGLVKHILQVADVSPDVDRVALCLGSIEDGPFVIVARDGHFVTCLGEGMQLREGQPVISRHRLDTISESVEAFRSLVADAHAGKRRQTQRKLERIFRAGSDLSQEEFEDVARWLPVLAVDFVRFHIEIVGQTHELVEYLGRYKSFSNRRREQALHEYWRAAWAVAHLTMLLGSDGGAALRRLFDQLEPEFPGCTMQLPWCLIRQGVASFAARGAWVASKLPALVIPAAKRRYLDPEATFLMTLTDGLSLAAAALRNRKYQAEVRKTLAKASPADVESTDVNGALHKFCLAFYDQHCADPQIYLNHTIQTGRALLRQLYSDLPEPDVAALDQLPSEVPVALLLQVPLALGDDVDVIRSVFERLPWIVGVEAKTFYLPEPYMVFARRPWTPAEGLALLDARRRVGLPPRPQPAVSAKPKVGRNERCPCGSGKKYKRCCGAA